MSNYIELEEKLKSCFKNKQDYAFLIGNGINLAYYNTDKSWKDLLGSLSTSKDNSFISREALSNLEKYDLISYKQQLDEKKSRENLVDIINENYKSDASKNEITDFRNKLEKANCPILTTNYDKRLDKGLIGVSLRYESNKIPYRYPWNYCFVPKTKESKSKAGEFDPINEFAVWHINGTVDYKYTIRLGLDDYVGLFVRERKFYPTIMKCEKGDSLVQKSRKQKSLPTTNTWLDVFYKKSLCLLGIGLRKDEIFLRHLLIKRHKYRRNGGILKDEPTTRSSDVFIYGVKASDNCKETDEEAVLFLKHLNFNVIRVSITDNFEYCKMYNAIGNSLDISK